MGKSKAAKVQVPECRYGAACTRKDCVFKHPPKKQTPQAPSQDKSDKVCFAFVAGRCAFGKQCRDKHPDLASCRTIRERYGKIDCQWGRGCRTEGCLYRHPGDEPVGPAMPVEQPKPQPAVFAEGPKIVPQPAMADDGRGKAGQMAQMPIPKAIWQAADLRDASAFDISDPLERFFAVNAHNSGTQSAALLDLHFQSTATFQSVLDEVLPDRLRMFPHGVWVVTGTGHHAPSKSHQRHADGGVLFDAVREYLVRRRYHFAVGHDTDGQQGAYFVRGRKKREDPLEGVRAVLLCGLPGSGKSMIAEALVRKSCGRFVRISQDEMRGDRAACEVVFKQALVEMAESTENVHDKSKAGTWWWDHAFCPERYYLAISLRTSSLKFLSECCGICLPHVDFLHATLAYQPTALDLRRQLGRPYRLTFRCHLQLEATSPPYTNELFEAILCAAQVANGDSADRPVPLHITLAAPRGAARHLAVLNAVPLDKRIHANAMLGTFKVRQVIDLTGSMERVGLSLLMYKVGDYRDTPAAVSFDASVLTNSRGQDSNGTPEWSQIGDAALTSLDPLVVLEDVNGDSDHDWCMLAAGQCAASGMDTPQIQVSRPMGGAEVKLQQWMRLKPSCLLHCAAEEVDVAHWLREGAAVLRRNGGVALPTPANEAREGLPGVVVLDRCNLERAERKQWVQLGGLRLNEVVTLHLDVPEAECISRVRRRGMHHPTLKAASTPEAAAAVQLHVERMEPPSEREGFRAIVRLKGAAAAAQELVRRWTEEDFVEADEVELRRLAEPDEDPETIVPSLPRLKQWIEVEEQGGRTSVWGVPLGAPVDAPLEGLRDGNDGEARVNVEGVSNGVGESASSAASTKPKAGTSGWGDIPLPTALVDADLDSPQYESLLQEHEEQRTERHQRLLATREVWSAQAGMQTTPQSISQSSPQPRSQATVDERASQRSGILWPSLEPEAQGGPPREEDDEERARQEQLAATLRCMGFDEEPSLQAAQRAGGNLNVAVDAVLHSSGRVL